MILHVKKLVTEIAANEIVKLSSIVDFDKDKLNILSDLTLDKSMDVGVRGHQGACTPTFSQIFM